MPESGKNVNLLVYNETPYPQAFRYRRVEGEGPYCVQIVQPGDSINKQLDPVGARLLEEVVTRWKRERKQPWEK